MINNSQLQVLVSDSMHFVKMDNYCQIVSITIGNKRIRQNSFSYNITSYAKAIITRKYSSRKCVADIFYFLITYRLLFVHSS